MNDSHFMKIALYEAEKAYKKGEIPVGAVIVENNKVLAKGHNERCDKKIVTKHAEIIAIERANKKKKDWRLNNCSLYVTLEPCKMCMGAIEQARISRVIYATESIASYEADFVVQKINDDDLSDESSQLINACFKDLREK